MTTITPLSESHSDGVAPAVALALPDGANPADVFLTPHEPGEGDDPRDHRTPAREGNAVRSLVSAAEVYPALERGMLEARDRVCLTFRILDPYMRTLTEEARAQGLEDWADLLVDAARRGVTVRFLLSDFDPIMAADLHRLSWRSYHHLAEKARSLEPEAHARLQMIVSLHEAQAGLAPRTAFWPIVWRRLSGLATALSHGRRHTLGRPPHELNRRLRESEELSLRELPGVWQVVSRVLKLSPEEWEDQLERSAEEGHLSRLRAPLWPPAKLWPVTHHQKFAIFDDVRMVVGGLDVNERRYDDPHHERPAEEAWHDVSLQVEGPVVADALRHFATMWNAEGPRAREVAEEIAPVLGRYRLALPDDFDAQALRPSHEIGAGAGPVRAQFVRTLSIVRGGPFAFQPRGLRRDLEAAHHAIIAAATRVLYIETQFFRLRSLSRAIAERAAEAPDLKVIILLPNAPEDIAWDDNAGPDAQHGEFLQVRALNLLKRKLGGRLGLFTLVQRGRPDEETGRARAFGNGIIYIHSKVAIADDRAALVSSANLNGRSFRWDTEAGLLWAQGGQTPDTSVRDLRRKLWNAHMPAAPDADWPLETAFDTWSETATANANAPPQERNDFVMPYQIGRARRFAARSLFIPDDMI